MTSPALVHGRRSILPMPEYGGNLRLGKLAKDDLRVWPDYPNSKLCPHDRVIILITACERSQ
jgi:hypothetical protein